MEKNNMTAVEWLADKYNYVTWLRNRDEISPGMADEYRKNYLEQAKLMEEQNIRMAWTDGHALGSNGLVSVGYSNSKEYYDVNYSK